MCTPNDDNDSILHVCPYVHKHLLRPSLASANVPTMQVQISNPTHGLPWPPAEELAKDHVRGIGPD